MRIRTISDLGTYLKDTGLSPERLAKTVGISNMTLRRLMERPPESAIPKRYLVTLNYHLGGMPDSAAFNSEQDFAPLMESLAEAGSKLTEEEILAIQDRIRKKLSETDTQTFAALTQTLLRVVALPTKPKYRALALGALLYFINPLDYVPDAMVGIGLIDDFGVLAFVAGLVNGGKKA
ncbi:DUF1232 domain-containing protein [bacterium]|nr:DUF1232 domain-containing protein [bacterium]